VTVDLLDVGFGALFDWSVKLPSKSGQIYISTHFALPCAPPFTASPFIPTQLRVLFVEAGESPED
jgi:hypothetical protein